MVPEPDAAKAEEYFDRALAVARAQQTKYWELRAAIRMAGTGAIRANETRRAIRSLRLTARASTRFDLKEAKKLLDETAP